MSYPINYPTPQGANVQIFNCVSKDANRYQSWVKPQGASMVWFTLIGGGGGGGGSDGTTDCLGGGSGAVTNLMIPAFLVPDNLLVSVGSGGSGGSSGGAAGAAGLNTAILTTLGNTGGFLTYSPGGNGGDFTSATGGSATAANFFTAAGIYQSVAGQDGTTSSPSASSTTFLQGGGAIGISTSNYGYSNGTGSNQGARGYFQMSPIIVGVSGTGNGANGTGNGTYKGGIGCGGAGSSAAFGVSSPGSDGGNGLAIIITW